MIAYRWWQIARSCKENRPMDILENLIVGEFLPQKEGNNGQTCSNPKHV